MGAFGVDKANRVQFIIPQKDARVLYYIRAALGFGRVIKYAEGDYRYEVHKVEQINALIEILRGRIILKRTILRYNEMIGNYNKYNNATLGLEPEGKKKLAPLMENSWLAGLIDAEGSFGGRLGEEGSKAVRLEFTLEQTNEREGLEVIQSIYQPANAKTWGTLSDTTNGAGSIDTQWRIDTLEELEPLIRYLGRYPLQSRKHIAYAKWKKIYNLQKDRLEKKRPVDYVREEAMLKEVTR